MIVNKSKLIETALASYVQDPFYCYGNCSKNGVCEPTGYFQFGMCKCNSERTGLDCATERKGELLSGTLCGTFSRIDNWNNELLRESGTSCSGVNPQSAYPSSISRQEGITLQKYNPDRSSFYGLIPHVPHLPTIDNYYINVCYANTTDKKTVKNGILCGLVYGNLNIQCGGRNVYSEACSTGYQRYEWEYITYCYKVDSTIDDLSGTLCGIYVEQPFYKQINTIETLCGDYYLSRGSSLSDISKSVLEKSVIHESVVKFIAWNILSINLTSFCEPERSALPANPIILMLLLVYRLFCLAYETSESEVSEVRCFGPDHLSRQALIRNHTRPLAKELLADGKDVAVIIMDGTYIYVQKKKKYTSEQANDNRMITVIRWIVEAANGRLKQFKYLDKIVPNSTLPYIFDYISIVAALINAFQAPCIQDTTNDQYIAGEMLQRRNKKNVLEEKLNDKEFLKVEKWEKMEGATDTPKFPPMGLAELNDITLGVFSVKQAISYVNEHIDENGL
ncbi:unnamed protein product [Didymodactylos carnosus]|uniref:EGF-like domain-containing protein n=1 Tax=Didymodactylos carnosus TaxID=1234261 RepID=A0A8S2MEQ9_9BILA|nr:unnamed protein product [Didymodactylos carnosus]CAF3952442.1 unnamed protein product [Didymodactylos carnosus]